MTCTPLSSKNLGVDHTKLTFQVPRPSFPPDRRTRGDCREPSRLKLRTCERRGQASCSAGLLKQDGEKPQRNAKGAYLCATSAPHCETVRRIFRRMAIVHPRPSPPRGRGLKFKKPARHFLVRVRLLIRNVETPGGSVPVPRGRGQDAHATFKSASCIMGESR